MKDKACPNCGYIGKPKRYTKGSIGWELVLWILFIIPGVFYSIWRIASKYWGCRSCGSRDIVPIDSPRGRQILKAGEAEAA